MKRLTSDMTPLDGYEMNTFKVMDIYIGRVDYFHFVWVRKRF